MSEVKAGDAKALAEYNLAISLQPNRSVQFSNRGEVYVDQGKYDEAMADFNKAIKISDSQVYFAYYYRGLLYEELGDVMSARQDLQKAADLGYQKAEHELEKLS